MRKDHRTISRCGVRHQGSLLTTGSGLYAIPVYHRVSQLKARLSLVGAAGRIEASHFPESGIFATLNRLKSQKSASSSLESALSPTAKPEDIEIIEEDVNDCVNTSERYMRQLIRHFYENETSIFMKSTIARVLDQVNDTSVSRFLVGSFISPKFKGNISYDHSGISRY